MQCHALNRLLLIAFRAEISQRCPAPWKLAWAEDAWNIHLKVEIDTLHSLSWKAHKSFSTGRLRPRVLEKVGQLFPERRCFHQNSWTQTTR